MDPLSITTSVLTLVAAVSEGVKRLQTLYDAPREILALANEISDLEVVITEVANALEDQRQFPPKADKDSNQLFTGRSQENISKLLSRVEGSLTELSTLMNQKLVTTDSDGEKVKYARISWLKNKGKVDDIRKKLDVAKLSLTTVLSATTSVNVSAVLLRLEGITLATDDGIGRSGRVIRLSDKSHRTLEFTGPPTCNRTAAEPDNSPERQQANEADATVMTRRPLTHRSAEEAMLETFSADSSSVFNIQTTRSSCPRWCSCICHKPGRLKSLQLFNQVLGSLSIGYVGLPYLSDLCNEKMCRARSGASTTITYQFPAWFLTKTLSIILSSWAGSPELSLKILRVRPANAEVFRLAITGDLDGVKSMFSKGQASIYDVDAQNWSILHKAFLVGKGDVCDFLIKAGADLRLEATNGSSVLERAWYFDRTNTGTAVNRAVIQSQIINRIEMEEFAEMQQYTTLHKIVLGLSHLDLAVQLEASTATIDYVDSRGRTALWWASARGNEEFVRLLLVHGASIHVGPKRSHGTLHIARNPAVLKLLLEHGGQVDCYDENGRTPLHCCSYRGFERGSSVDLLKCLLESGADVNARSAAGQTPLHYAAMYGFEEHMRLLLREGADLESRKNDGCTPLMQAVQCNQPKVAKILLESGADYKCSNLEGRTIIHMAAANGNVATMEGISSANLDGCDVEKADQKGFTARNLFQERNDTTETLQNAFENLLGSIPATKAYSIGASDPEECEDSDGFEDAVEVWSSDENG